jgi:phosphoglucosamine mutase
MAGLCQVVTCGVVPTPGLSRIIVDNNYDYGIMITASHNPYFDNGIKIFNRLGEKISDAQEDTIEQLFSATKNQEIHPDTAFGMAQTDASRYRQFLLAHIKPLKSEKLKLVLDCANGATYKIAPEVMAETGCSTTVINSQPSGRNINEQCGSLSPDSLVKRVKDENSDLGIAFDGDGDRIIVADSHGHVLEGDHILYLLAKYLHATGKMREKLVVGTVMSNGGLALSLSRMGYQLVRTDVGDRSVYREMKNRDAVLGGEQSGHIILRELQNTGDGTLSAIFFLQALKYFNLHPNDVYSMVQLFPQATRSFLVREKRDLADWKQLQKMIHQFNGKHGKDSRILIRYSGTEPKIRVMIESADPAIIAVHLNEFENFIMSEIGG